MQRQARPGLVPVDDTRVGREAAEARARRRLGSEILEHVGHGRPTTPGIRIMAVVAVAVRSVTHPTAPQLVIATDIRWPPGVTMWRNGAISTTRRRAVTHGASKRRANSQSSRRSRREPHIPNPILEQIVDHFAS